jgi:dolichol-phosphate mannosyltransferase
MAAERQASSAPNVAVVIPCYRVRDRVLDVIARVGPEVAWIFVVDDACPEGSGDHVERECRDPRVRVLRHATNAGVGAAVATGYRAALDTAAIAVVKLDGDGQMDPALIALLVRPLQLDQADYVKGNRFHPLGDTAGMPALRLFGNAALSFLTKLSTGYWQVFDPTNGYTAIHVSVLRLLPLERVAARYFFESDMLYHLNQVRAVVRDLPMRAVYGDETSSLRPLRTVIPFLRGHLRNFTRRLINSYFVRGFSLASVELALGMLLLGFGSVFGATQWWQSNANHVAATAGTVMLAALPVIVGMQLVLSWLNFDVAAEPRTPISSLLDTRSERRA